MGAHTSHARTFFDVPKVVLAAEQMTYGATADWHVDMVGCGIVIEEKATFRHATSRWLENAASQLESIPSGSAGRLRVLWLTRNAGSDASHHVTAATIAVAVIGPTPSMASIFLQSADLFRKDVIH